MDESGRHRKASRFLGGIQYLIWLTLAQELTDSLENPSLVCQLSRRFTASLLPHLLHLGLDMVVWQLSPCSTELSHFLSWGFSPQKIIACGTWSWSLSQRTWTIIICYLKLHDNIIRHRKKIIATCSGMFTELRTFTELNIWTIKNGSTDGTNTEKVQFLLGIPDPYCASRVWMIRVFLSLPTAVC